MTKVKNIAKPRGVLDEQLKIELLNKLEKIGNDNFHREEIKTLFGKEISKTDLNDKEFLARYLLLVTALDQQAESENAREVARAIYSKFGSAIFMDPQRYLDKLYEILELVNKLYKPKSRVLRMKAEAASLLRIGGFLLAITNVHARYQSILKYLSRAQSPRKLLELILNDQIIGGILYEKAARMYVAWVSHPKLFIDISNGKWNTYEIPMLVDGHVAKVLARAGFLNSVKVEPITYIVKASEMRDKIEREVTSTYKGDNFMIDYGAFYVGKTYCKEENPNCNICPLNNICKKNVEFKAY